VLFQNETPSKCTSKFNPIPYTVKDTKGPMVSVESDSGHRVTRNSSVMKTVQPTLCASNMEMNNTDDDLGDDLLEDGSGQTTEEANIRPTRERRPPVYLRDYVRNVEYEVP